MNGMSSLFFQLVKIVYDYDRVTHIVNPGHNLIKSRSVLTNELGLTVVNQSMIDG